MTGSLILDEDPTEDLEAATKQYVDNHTITAMVYDKLPTKPVTPVADGEEIPYTWEEINAITLAGKAQEYFSLGSTKLVNLSTEVLGANAATMMVIGFNQDGENTTTFQTKGSLPTNTTFGSSDAVWIGSTARTECQNFYNYCSAKAFIKTVSKGTCPSTNKSRNGMVTYTDETVWVPSEREMGLDAYSSLSTANSTTSKAECTQGYNAAYSYYTSNTTRVKYQMSADGSLTTTENYYWERSRGCYNSYNACLVYDDGSAGSAGYVASFYLAPAFVIGNSDAPSSGKITQDGEDITNKLSILFGGVKIATGSYAGTGSSGSQSSANSLSFGFVPKLLLIRDSTDRYTGLFIISGWGNTTTGTNYAYVVFTNNTPFWGNGYIEGNTVYWWYSGSNVSQYQLNTASQNYYYVAVG